MDGLDAQLLDIKREQAIEQEWWGRYAPFYTPRDITDAVRWGVLVPAHSSGVWRISANCRSEFHALTPPALALLEHITTLWEQGLYHRKHQGGRFLVVTSLTRPVEFQQQLLEEQATPVLQSSHTRGYAFDISYSWFHTNDRQCEKALKAVLKYIKGARLANVIKEKHNKIFHVSPSPDFVARQKRGW